MGNCCNVFADESGLCCCMDMDRYKQVELDKVVPNSQRHCTDVPCCCIVIVALILEIWIAVVAYEEGANPHLMTDGYDYELEMCELVVWPSLSEYKIRICIDENASCNDITNDANNPYMIDNYPSKQFVNSYCLPTDLNELQGTEVEEKFHSYEQTWESAMVDLRTAKWLVIIMSFTAVILSFIYVKIIAYIGRFLVWFAALLLLGGGVVLSYFLISKGLEDMNHSETETSGKWQVSIGITISVIVFILVLIIWFERKNVKLVIEMLRESSHALSQLPFTLCAPIYFSILSLAYTFAWGIEFAYVYSVKVEVGPIDMPQTFIDNGNYGNQYWYLDFDPIMETALIIHVIIWFYFMQFIIYLGFMTLAGVFADWYFSQWEDEVRQKKVMERSWPICSSFWRTCRFHLGSIAFASLVLTIIRMMRACVQYIESKVIGSGNPISKCCFACVKCCLWCCQWIFDKINKNGLIFITIYGNSYCYASYSSFKLIIAHLDTSVMVSAVATSSEILGKFMISVGLTAISVLCMVYMEYYKNNLTSYVFPAFVILIICYIVSSLFMGVFEVAVETIYLSYLIDETVNNGVAKFATGEFEEIKRRQSSAIDQYISSDNNRSEAEYLTTAV
eukprot:81872_1